MKKRFLALLLVLTLLVGLMPAALAADTVDVSALPEYTAGADTSAGAAYKISTEESLRAFAAAVKADDGKGTYSLSGVSFYLANDIALTGAWTPVGNGVSAVKDFFAGTFDGCGHTISGLNVQGQGLFAAINQAAIRNLNVSGTVNSTVSYVGGIVGKVQAGTIENCSFSGSVSSSKSKAYVGGIAGGLNSANVTISGCANTADVTGGYAGGILGYWRTAATIQNCYNTGSITGSDKAGGIVGQLNKGTIENCYSIGDIGGKASQKGGIFAFSNATVKNCYYTLPETEVLGGTAAAAMQITSPEGLAGKLGNAFKEDTAGANNGYPILVWQAGEAVQPDPRIELTGPDTLWRTANEPQPQTTIAAACKDMDKDTQVDWTLTEGEGIVTLETPEGAGAANQSVIVKATADGAGKAVITASTANSITASLTIYVIPQITTVELEGVVAVGETVRAKINVLGGGEYDYENFPKLKIEWRYLTAADYRAGNTGTSSYKEITGTTGREYTIPEDMAGNYLSFLLYDTVSREYKTLSSPVRIATAEERLLKADASALTLDTSDIRAATTTLTLPAAGAVNGSAITWASSDSSIISIIDPATGVVTLPASGIQTVTLSATLTRGEATAYRSFDIRVWSQAELDKEAAKSELRKFVERLDGTITLTPEYGRDTNVNTMLSAKLDDSSIAVSVSKVEEVYGGAGVAADGTITYFFVDPNTTPLVHNGSYNVTFALSKAGATETLQVPVVIGWDVQRVRDAISAEITSQLTTEGLCAAGEDPNLLTQDLTLPKVIDGKRWALISWTSSDPTAIAVSDKNQQTPDTLFDPYVGVVKTPAQDKAVTLTATVTFQFTDTQEQAITVSKVFYVTVKGQETTVREDLLAKLDAGFAACGGLRDAVTGLPLTQRDGKYLAANDIHFPTTRDFGVDGKDTPVTITSSDEDTIVPPDVNNAARAAVYRPLPGEAARDVTVTVTLTDADSGVAASRDFVIEVQPLTQAEIDAELALMAEVKAHYFDGIRNANTDAKNILTDLHPFQEAYLDADGQLVWVYDHADLTGSGIVPVAMDGWTESEQWRLFRSSNSRVISHENLLVTRPAEDKTVTIRSELSSETLGKYAARYPDNADFQALSRQAVSAKVTVVGTNTPIRAQLQAKLDGGFVAAGLRDAYTGSALTLSDGKYLTTEDILFPTMQDFGVDGRNCTVTVTSSDPETLAAPDLNDTVCAAVWRPLPGASAKDVTVTVTLTDTATGVAAERSFVVTVQPLTQAEIDAELALMAQVKAHYFDGIRNQNTDPGNVMTDLHAFQEAYLDADGQLVWVYDSKDVTGSGVIPAEMDNWQSVKQWSRFRSSDPAVISHENLSVTRAAEDTVVTIFSELTSERLGKYAAHYPDNAELQKLSHQAVSVELTVTGTTPVEPTPVEPTPVEPTPVEPTPVEPTPVEPTPVEPTPVEPTPVEPTPVEPTPVEPTPVEPTPVEPTPVEPTPVEPTPVEPTPVEPTPVEPTPVEPTPVDPTPVDPTPVEPTPVEPTPVEPTPVEPTPVEPTPVDPTPVDPDPETITVTFQLHTDTDAWILPTVVRDLPEGTTAFEVFKQVLAANGYTYDAKGSYVRAVIAPDGTKVAELSKGQYSGWMYRVNGEFPDTYMGAYELEDGDVIEVFFTADYTKETGAFLPFVDVTNHWAYTDIKRVYNRGWMVGESATIFAPDQDLTRAMLAVILYAMAGEPEVTAANPFSDVPAGEWYTDAVIWAAANGIVVGCGDGTFRPEMAVTRAQAAVMLCGYAAFAGRDVTARADLSAFGDAADIPAWAQAEMQWANAEKLILGRDGKLLAPNAAATRAEMASILSGYAAA